MILHAKQHLETFRGPISRQNVPLNQRITLMSSKNYDDVGLLIILH